MYFFGGLERTGLLNLENVDRTNIGPSGPHVLFGGPERTGLLDLENVGHPGVDRTNIGSSGPHILYLGNGADWTSGLRKCGPSWSGLIFLLTILKNSTEARRIQEFFSLLNSQLKW